MAFVVTDAVREKIPILMAIYGPTGSGKTFSGLLVAAGLAGPHGVVGMLDAENKRGSLYSDDPDICAAMPGGKYKRVDIASPYSPARYIEALKALEAAGVTVALIDSTTHEWAGEGGCCDIASKNKLGGMDNWALAKINHKKFMAFCLSSQMNIIFCLRAHEKVKPVKAGDYVSPDSDERYEKAGVIPLGMLPDTEKNLIYEVLISLRVEDGTHFATPIKVPKMLSHVFSGKKLLSKADGEAIRQWNERGLPADEYEQTRKRSRAAATEGMAAYKAFWESILPKVRKALVSEHEENKRIAEQADTDRKAAESAEDSAEPSSETITIHTPPADAPEPPTDAPPESAPVEPSEPPPAPPEAAEAQETANGNGSELPDAHIINEADKIESETGNRPSLEDLRAQLAATRAHPKGRRK